jgi:BirA family biotin operon repressor/biotin-[acetyl-CoA-carboxylase] ligase
VVTECQTQGRGQRGNTWEAEPNQNVTVSVILNPSFLAIHQQFYLNICTSLAVLDLVQAFLPANASADFKVKWPNDIYYGNKKLGGILIENTIRGQFIQQAILGIGLNINQISFAYPGAYSWRMITGTQYALPQVVEGLLERLEARYLALRQGKLDALKIDYLQHLYRYQEAHLFRIGEETVTGCILGIDAIGRLSIQIEDKIRHFEFKEVAFIS